MNKQIVVVGYATYHQIKIGKTTYLPQLNGGRVVITKRDPYAPETVTYFKHA